MRIKFFILIRSVAFIGLTIVFGWNTSVWAKAHDQGAADGDRRINPGLFKAFDSIGQNLFGEAAFGASVVSITDADEMPAPAVRLDISGYPTIPNNPVPIVISVFDSDTCQTEFQVIVDGESDPIIIRDNFYGPPPKPCDGPGRDQ